MKLKLWIMALGLGLSVQASAAGGFCAKYNENAEYTKAIEIVAAKLKYSTEELCTLGRLADIYVDTKNIYNAQIDEVERHIWVTLHYYEYSCQYFVRAKDGVTTAQNCYNTF